MWMDFYVNLRVCVYVEMAASHLHSLARPKSDRSWKKCRFFDRMIINYSNLSSRDDVAPIYVCEKRAMLCILPICLLINGMSFARCLFPISLNELALFFV